MRFLNSQWLVLGSLLLSTVAFAQTTAAIPDPCTDKAVNKLVSTTERGVSLCEADQNRLARVNSTRSRLIDSYARVLTRSANPTNVCRSARLLSGCDLRRARNIIRDARSLALTRSKVQIELANIRASVSCQQADRAIEDLKLQLKICGYR